MAKTKRKSESIAAGITKQQYEEALAKYAKNNSEIGLLTAELERALTDLRDDYDGDLSILEGENKMLMAVIKGYCVQNRESLFVEKKSVDTLFGKLGFRTGQPALKLLSGRKWDDVLEKLKEHLPGYVRTVEEPDKAKLLADREKEDVAKLFPTVGVKVSQDEAFFIELKEEVAA